MITEDLKGVLLSALVIASLMAPAISISFLSVDPVSALPDPYENIVRGKWSAYGVNLDAVPPWQLYMAGDRPPIMAAKRAGLGAVVAGGISSTCRNGRWNHGYNPDNRLDILLHYAFQWMVPGADNVLWYEGYNVYNKTAQCSDLVSALTTMGYSIVGDNTAPITQSLLAPYDILVIPQLQLGSAGTGGDPSLLPDEDVQTIKGFVENGKGLLIMEGGDYGGYNFYRVQNKIIKELDFGIYFQSDSIYDNINRWWREYEIFADVENRLFGENYRSATGKTTIGLYSVCSLTETEPYDVVTNISPEDQAGVAGATLRYTVTVINVGRENDNYTLTVVDNENWSLNISPAELHVGAGESEIAVLKVGIPSEAPIGAKDNVIVTATSHGDPAVSDSASCTASVSIHLSKVGRVKISNPYRNYSYWFKGNLHSHTENSDGENTVDEMMAAYRSKGYSFNAITDHNYITNSEAFTDLPNFLGINGEEVTKGGGPHMLAINVENLIGGWWYRSVAEWVGDILAQGGIAIPAHPGYSGAPFPLENLRQAVDAGAKLMEVHGGTVEDVQRAREIWDTLLTENRIVYGAMDDDAHSVDSAGKWGWNVVNAPELTKDAILQNLREGNFYCAQGLPFGIGPEIYSVTVENENVIVVSAAGDYVTFIGDNGVTLDSADMIGGMASYSPTVGARYIRMEVSGDGGISYTQPLLVSAFTLSVVISPEYQDAPPETPLTYTITVKNFGTENDNYDLTVSDDAGWGPSLLENRFENVPPGENRQTTLSVTVPENAVICTEDNITVTATSMENVEVRDNDVCIAHAAIWTGTATFALETLYKVNLYKDNLWLHGGRKLVVKFYNYDNVFENENVIHENFALPWHVVPENENVAHPGNKGVEKAKLFLMDNLGSEISKVKGWETIRDDLWTRAMGIRGEWPYASLPERDDLWMEFMGIRGQWVYAPSARDPGWENC